MKKKGISSYYITLMLILQVFGATIPVSAITETQKNAIYDHCEAIRDNLKDLQRSDSRVRVQLGRYYETILSKFIVPLNVRLVENNLPGSGLINNQNDFNATRSSFIDSYIDYQKGLEELTLFDCKAEPERFYEKLVEVRAKRATVAEKTAKLKKLAGAQVKLVQELETKL